jgi:vacuolar-type H+-ATPase subunit E/Vma4
MKNLDTAKGKIQSICDAIKNEAIEPANQKAKEILDNAKLQAAEIVEQAKRESEQIHQKTDKELAEKKQKVETALRLAGREALASLKETLKKDVFSPTFKKLIQQPLNQEKVVSNLIDCLVEAIKKEGIDGDLIAYVSKKMDPKKVSEAISSEILRHLSGQKIHLGNFEGGVVLSIVEDKISLDMSDQALFEMFTKYLRKDFYHFIFSEPS